MIDATNAPRPAGQRDDDGITPLPPATWAAPGASWPVPPAEPSSDAAADAAAAEGREPGPADPFNEDGHPPAELMRDLVGPDAATPAPDADVHLADVDGPDADLEPGAEDPNRPLLPPI